MLGVTVAQLYRLQNTPDPHAAFGYFLLSKPLACLLQGAAMVLSLSGTFRYFRQQSALARGRVYAGGLEVLVICVSMFLVGRPVCLQ